MIEFAPKHNSYEQVTEITSKISINKLFVNLFKNIKFNNLPDCVFEIEDSLWGIIDENICVGIAEADNRRLQNDTTK